MARGYRLLLVGGLTAACVLAGVIGGPRASGQTLQSTPDTTRSGQPGVVIAIASLLMERINHVEQLLVGSLLGFFLTATAGTFAAAYTIRGRKNRRARASEFTHRQFFYGIALVYAFISGFYYYMLGQYYSAVITVSELFHRYPVISFADLYKPLRIPTFGPITEDRANILMLSSPPVFPLAVSIALTLGMYVYLVDGNRKALRTSDFVVAGLSHLLLCGLMISHPYLAFLEASKLRW